MKHVCRRIRWYATIPPVFQPHAEELFQLFSHGALQVDERNENENAIKERERERTGVSLTVGVVRGGRRGF